MEGQSTKSENYGEQNGEFTRRSMLIHHDKRIT